MANIPFGALLRHLHGMAEAPAQADASDGQLLERFVTHHEEAAFAALLHRHGPMVLSVCRRALPNEQDREDVFQATFLLLAHKASSIRKRDSVSCWLHGVAHRLAANSRVRDIRRRVQEKQAILHRASESAAPEAWQEMQALLDEAIAELPEKYRAALVLCYLEDHTHEDAARRLGCALTTLRSRVARGRERLRVALVRRGLALSSSALLALVATSAAKAGVPLSLRSRTLTAALRFTKGEAASRIVSASSAALVQEGLQAMAEYKLKYFLVLLLSFGLALSGAGLLAHQALGVKQAAENRAEPPQPADRAAPPATASKPKGGVDRFGDPLPERAIARLGTVRFRMSGLVCACAWSPDGKTLAAGSATFSADNTISLFDAASGKPLRQLGGNHFHITSLAYSPDGRTLASGSRNSITLWEPVAGKLLRQFSSHPGPLSTIWSVAFTPDGKGLISAGGDTLIRLWDPATGKEVRRYVGHQKAVRCAVLSPDGRTIASAADKAIRVWETATGKMIRRLTGPNEPIRSLAFSPDGKLLASGNDDGSISAIWLWETATGKVRRRLPEDPKLQKRGAMCVRSLAFSPDGNTLAAGYADYTLCLWDVATGKKLHEMPGVGSTTHSGFHDGGIQCVAFSPDGEKLVFGRDNQLARLDVQSGKEISPFQTPRGAMRRIFFSPDGKRLLTTNDDPVQRILEWDSTSGRLMRQIPGKAMWAHLVRFSPDRKIMASTWNAPTLNLWDTTTGKEIRRIPLPLKLSQSPGDVAFSPDGKLLAVEEAQGKAVWLIDPATGKQACTVEGMGTGGIVAPLAFSSDGRLLAAAATVAIHLAEVPSGRQLLRIDLPKDRYSDAIDISPDGRTLAAPCRGFLTGQTMTLWETATGKERLVFPGPRNQVTNVAFSPDGRLLAAGGWDRTVFLWDTAAGKQVGRLEGHQGNVEYLAFSPDGRRLASASQDTTVLIWDVSTPAKKPRRSPPLTPKEQEALWSVLAGADAAKAYQAILTLEGVPDQAVPLLAERLRLKPAADPERIARLLVQLDSEVFSERERATAELRRLGWLAEPALREMLEGKPSLEVRKRAQELLDGIQKQELPPELLRMLRGVEVLERIGTAEARRLLASLAKETPQTRLTREAKAALQLLELTEKTTRSQLTDLR